MRYHCFNYRLSSIRIKLYHTDSVTSSNSIISRYARLGQIHNARKMFDQIPERSIASWNSIIAAYFQNGQPREAQKLFDRMPERNIVSWNALVSGFVKNRMVNEARGAFDSMPERNVISWTSMVRGYVQEGLVSEAEVLFSRMPEKNVVSWSVMLNGLIDQGRIDDARRMFDEIPEKDIVTRTKMIGGYSESGRLAEAREIFDAMKERNVVTWTTMINGYVQNLKVDLARKLFEVSPEKNEVTWTVMVMGYTRAGRVREAKEVFDAMPVKSSFACVEMMLGFGRAGDVEEATRVFDGTVNKDQRVWNAMIKIYERNGLEPRALEAFASMQRLGVLPSFPSFVSVLAASASLASLDHGRQVHGRVIASDLSCNPFIASSLMNMYSKCGEIEKAEIVFGDSLSKDVVMWNAMIAGYAQHGMGPEATGCFRKMVLDGGAAPDLATFVGVLSACNHGGMVEEGLGIFESMESEHRVEPTKEHYACVVDLLGRAGRVEEAMGLVEKMTGEEPDVVVWGSLLGSCRSHMRLDLAEVAAGRLFELEPESSGSYTLLSQIYASRGRWSEAAETRNDMKSKSVTKSPGCSWIEVEKRVHMFTGGDGGRRHPEHSLILRKLESLYGLLREAGYSPDGTFVAHDVEEEEKTCSLSYHSEKLAVAYGLMKLAPPRPIRVMKNLRVCGDCHAAIKLISKITGREIVLRDANRFHRFKDGSCSCGDYW